MNYINIDKKRLCGRNNNVVPPLIIDYSTIENVEFTFINSQNQIVPVEDGLSGFYMAGSVKMGEPSCELLFLSKDFQIVDGKLVFSIDTYTQPYLRQIKKKNTEINIEIGQISLESKKIWLRDYALANPRVYVAGLSPQEIESNDFFTKTETQELVDAAEAEAKEYADDLAASTLLSSQTYTDEAISHIGISGYVTDEELEAAKAELDGKIALKADEADLQVVSGTVDTNSENIQTLSGDVDALKLDITHKAEQSVVAAISGDLDELSGKVDAITVPTKVSELDNDSGYATSGYVDDGLALKQDIIDESNPISGNAVLVTYDPWTGDPEFTAEAAINMTHAEALQAQADATQANADIQIVSGVVDEKQDIIDGNNPLDAAYVRMDLDPYSGGDPDFDVETAVNMVHAEALEALSGLNGKLDIPSGGTAGQILTKTADGTEWADAQGGGGDNGYVNYFKVFCYIIGSGHSGDEFKITKINHDEEPLNLQYSRDAGKTWTQYTWDGRNGETLTNFPICGIWFKGNNASFNINASKRYRFALGNSTKHYKLAGNIMTLLDETGKLDKVPDNCFNMAFYNNAYLDDISELELPADYVGIGGYASMFEGCSRITTIPKLPATHLNRNAYASMFKSCTSLKKVAHIKSVVAWRDTYSDYNSGWRIYSDGDGPLNYMFMGCSSLSSVEVDFDTWLTYTEFATSGGSKLMTVSWLNGVTASGQFICPYGLDTSTRDASHIPAGWEIIYKEVPESIVNQAAAVENLIMNND